jgi:hypothetical protein
VSDEVLRIVPTDPGWTPDDVALRRAVRALRQLLPRADGVRGEIHDGVVLITAGGEPEQVACPACGEELAPAWWEQRLERAAAQGFARLAVVTPCSATWTSLAELRFDRPAAFARTELRARARGTGLTEEALAEVGRALGHPVRELHTGR